jgi:hypothetical protein
LLLAAASLVVPVCSQDDESQGGTPTSESSRALAGSIALVEGFVTDKNPRDPFPFPPPFQPKNGTLCWGDEGYKDMTEGTAVVVRDESGTTIAAGRLGVGAYTRDGGDCIFEFTIDDVPEAAFYSVEVADRGEITYSADELEAADWSVELSVGD